MSDDKQNSTNDNSDIIYDQWDYEPKGVFTFGDRFACEPGEGHSVSQKLVGKMLVIEQKSSLAELKVVFSPHMNERLPVAKSVLVYASSLVSMVWAKEVFEIDGKKVIFVPKDAVIMVRT